METATPKAQLHLQRVLQQCGDYNFSPTPRTASRKESLYAPEPLGASLQKGEAAAGGRRSSRYRSHSILSLDNNGNTPSRDAARSQTTLNRASTAGTEDEDPTVQYHMKLEVSTNSSTERQHAPQPEEEDAVDVAAAEAMADAHEAALLAQLAQQKLEEEAAAAEAAAEQEEEEEEDLHAHEAVSNHEGQAEVNMVVEPPSESADESAADRYAEVSEEEGEAYDPYAQEVAGPHEDEYPEEEEEQEQQQYQYQEEEEGHDDAYDDYTREVEAAQEEDEEEEEQQQYRYDADEQEEDEEAADRGAHGYGEASEEEEGAADGMAAYDRGLHDVAGRYADADAEEEDEDEYEQYPSHQEEDEALVDETQPFQDREAVAAAAAEAETPAAETHELYRAISNAKRMLSVPAEDALADPIAYQRLLGASPAPEEIPQTAAEATDVVESLPLHALANYRAQQGRAASADPALAEEVGYWKERAEALRQQIIDRETILQQQQMEREHEEMEAAERAAAARARSMSVAEEYSGEDPLEHLEYQERDGRRRVVREEEEHFFALLEVADRSLDRALGAGPLLNDAPDLAHYPAHLGEDAVLVNIALESELVDLRRQLHAANARIEELRYSNAELRKAVQGRAASQAIPPSLRSAISLFQ